MPGVFIVGIGGSLREPSLSLAALRHALSLAEDQGAATHLVDLRLAGLPAFHPDLDLDGYAPEDRDRIAAFLEACRRADGFLWSSPTYHGTITGVFKNAIDFIELMYDDDPPYLTGKAVGLIAIADSTPLAAMASCVHELRAWAAPTRLTLTEQSFDASLRLAEGAPLRRATRLAGEIISFASRSNGRG